MNKCKFCDNNLSIFSESYLQCTHCDILISSLPEGSYDAKYYYVENYRSKETQFRSKQLFKYFKQYIGEKKCLDFGCNDGSYVLYSRAKGIDCIGIDINKYVMAKNKSHSPDIFFHPDEIRSKFSCVTAFDVIEHFDDINVFFHEIERFVDSTGMLIFTTPNVHSKWIKIYKKGWHGYGIPKYHRYIFSVGFLKNILMAKGFNVDAVFTVAPIDKNGFSLLVRSGYRLKKKKIEKLLLLPVAIIKYLLGNFKNGQEDTICIVARKK
ncbi:class I SAM-dependent methyltransferase [candidate division TA06 bacterium]|uniref:Class I SAM-dependent methyltransferase n=1 Tax=candidate division TA06 bacterium TaxID=2250710 RepID=A0A933IAB8_UNCT6|nr:class I SAM-dependent methyltransferase [candidate division TA06 bacterium]